jgi:hypothetical protein
MIFKQGLAALLIGAAVLSSRLEAQPPVVIPSTPQLFVVPQFHSSVHINPRIEKRASQHVYNLNDLIDTTSVGYDIYVEGKHASSPIGEISSSCTKIAFVKKSKKQSKLVSPKFYDNKTTYQEPRNKNHPKYRKYLLDSLLDPKEDYDVFIDIINRYEGKRQWKNIGTIKEGGKSLIFVRNNRVTYY